MAEVGTSGLRHDLMGEALKLARAASEVEQHVVDAGCTERREAVADLVRSPEEGMLLGVAVSKNV
jgi:hypothetical protein